MHSENEVVYLYLDDIIPNRFQPREVFDERALKELAISIKEHGVIQPIIVRSIGQKYEIIAGERRYKASALAGLTKIPAIVRNLDDKESSKVALLENLQRRNLNPIEEARTYQKILELDQMTQEQLAKTMGKSQSAVANKLRLLALSDEVQEALLKEQISERHARSLLNIKDLVEQKELLRKIIEEKMTVRELEAYIKGEDKQEPEIDINSVSMPNTLDELLRANPDNLNHKTMDNSPTPIDFSGTFQTPQPMDTFNTNTNVNQNQFNISEDEVKKNRMPDIINYGEIDDDFLDEEDTFKPPSFVDTPIDLEKIKSNAVDINPPRMESESDGKNPNALDSLLNLGAPSPVSSMKTTENDTEADTGGRFFHVPEEKPKPTVTNNPTPLEDLFNSPGIIPTETPIEPDKINNNILDYDMVDKDLPLVPIDEPDTTPSMDHSNSASIGNRNLEESIKLIQRTLNELKQSGFNVDFDEMEMKNSYQMIIKISKD